MLQTDKNPFIHRPLRLFEGSLLRVFSNFILFFLQGTKKEKKIRSEYKKRKKIKQVSD